MTKANIGLIGLAVMGANLARNISTSGYKTLVYNRTDSKTKDFVKKYKSTNLDGRYSLKELVDDLETPRKIILMVKSGEPVDDMIRKLLPLLNGGDIIIDCGNSFYKDTQRRYNVLEGFGINFVGCGVSGGEEGALNGPSIMIGGNEKSWLQIRNIFNDISAFDFNGGRCVSCVGENGSGHFVKMVHNGIEYAVMQMIAEAYDSLRKIYNLNSKEISDIFKKYNSGKLNSYLFEITYKVLSKEDEFNSGEYLVDKILDKAGAKGTGKWTSIEGYEKGISISTIGEATFSRIISSQKSLRNKLSKKYKFSNDFDKINLDEYLNILEDTLYIGMLFAYAQGYNLISETSKQESWDVNLSEISRIWQGGCIIRAKILDFLTKAFANNTSKTFSHLFELEEIKKEIIKGLPSYKKFIEINVNNNISTPSLSSGINYFYSITSLNSPANLIQGLRDYFGAHTYERNDRKGSFHTKW